MVKIRVLLENFSINKQYKAKHGLSVLIEYHGGTILLDTGPDKKFIENARKMNIDLSKIDMLFLSHNHYDHTGGLNEFIRLNHNIPVYLMDNINNSYYAKTFLLPVSIGLNLRKKYRSSVNQINDDLIINNNIYFLKNTVSENIKPTHNKVLFKRENGKMVHDTFDHEGILVLEDNNELLIFNSCSHNGILNIIETVKRKIPGKVIRSYIGGLHLCNPSTKRHEDGKYLDHLAEKLKQLKINVYSGHCTGKFALNYLKEKLGNMCHEINTGIEIDV